jgi:GAF domain-containing protein
MTSAEIDLDGLASSGIAPQFESLSELLRTREPDELASRLVQFAVRGVPHAEHASLTVISPQQRPSTAVASDEVPLRVDRIQYDTGEGPCLAAASAYYVAQVEDMTTDPQWPRFARRCSAETPVRSMLAVRLTLLDQHHGALNLYASTAAAFSDDDIAAAAIFSPYITVALERKLQGAHLEAALASSRQIGTALGILMARHLLTREEAFDQLRVASQTLNRKLRDIAVEVELTGALPDLR